MTSQGAKRMAWGSAAIIGVLALATGGMAMAPPHGPVRMSDLRVHGLAGYVVNDSRGEAVGHIVRVDRDGDGRARFLRIALDQGGEVTVGSFRAWLDTEKASVALMLPEDILLSRVDAEAIRPSV